MSIHQAATRFGTLALLVAGGTLPASAQQAVTLDVLSVEGEAAPGARQLPSQNAARFAP